MNRRKFFGAIAAAVTAACIPNRAVSLHNVKIAFPSILDRKGPGYIAARYGSQHAWWRPDLFRGVPIIYDQDFAELEARTLAALQSAWKECLASKTGDTLLIDEQAYEVFKTLQE